MPELAEVETLARTLRPVLAGKTVLSAELRWIRTLASPSPAAFKRRIKGQQIMDVSRRGKFFVLELSAGRMLIHLRMSGDLLVVLGGYEPAPHDRLILHLSSDARLVFNDPRKFGRVWLETGGASRLDILGPEPLGEEFTPAWLYSALQHRRWQLKPLLLDQSFLAGLGNIYTDEALHLAGLHPLTSSRAVTIQQAQALHQSIRAVLQEGIRRNGASIDWVYRGGDFQNHFRAYGRTGQPCPVCGTAIQRILVGQRGTHFCPHCQPADPKKKKRT
jgi:formamidopyrimidine-DNA glycosylase